MEDLSFGNIAIATVIVGLLDLIIVVLVRTETILKVVERIKGVIKLDYKSRAKRSDDEIRISKKHELVARERVRNSFVTIVLWNCKWTWNWSKELEPINIKGFCLGDTGKNYLGEKVVFECNHPVFPYYCTNRNEDEKSSDRLIGITCTNPSENDKNTLLRTNHIEGFVITLKFCNLLLKEKIRIAHLI